MWGREGAAFPPTASGTTRRDVNQLSCCAAARHPHALMQGFPITVPPNQVGATLTQTLRKHVIVGSYTMEQIVVKSYNGDEFRRLAGK